MFVCILYMYVCMYTMYVLCMFASIYGTIRMYVKCITIYLYIYILAEGPGVARGKKFEKNFPKKKNLE